MNITTIKDTVRALAQSLQVTTVLPAAVFVLLAAYCILPVFSDLLDPSAPTTTVLVTSATLLLSYGLYAFNFPLIRLFEGYKLQDWDVTCHLRSREERRLRELRKEIDRLQFDRDDMHAKWLLCGIDLRRREAHQRVPRTVWQQWREVNMVLAKAKVDLDLRFSPFAKPFPATELGGTIAAFENYSASRYGIDALGLWPRLVPLLKEKQYTDFINQEKSVFDFLLNCCFLIVPLGLGAVYAALYQGKIALGLLLAVATVAVFVALYMALVIAARQWGTTVRVAFDLYRHDLHQRLGLKPMHSFHDEYQLWQRVSRFLLYRPEGEPRIADFLSQRQIERRKRGER